ncbi:hypothetical protein D3C84_400450 [compost metagenome]
MQGSEKSCSLLKIALRKRKNHNYDERYNPTYPSKNVGSRKLPQVNPQLYPQAGGLAIPPIPHYLGSQRRETYYMWGLPL